MCVVCCLVDVLCVLMPCFLFVLRLLLVCGSVCCFLVRVLFISVFFVLRCCVALLCAELFYMCCVFVCVVVVFVMCRLSLLLCIVLA